MDGLIHINDGEPIPVTDIQFNDIPIDPVLVDIAREYRKAIRAIYTTADGDRKCQHGVAMDVHCCGCHSGFLFDVETCVCASLARKARNRARYQRRYARGRR